MGALSKAEVQLAAKPIFIAGPTAVGKTEVALALAERVGGEIISVDSMQVYRGLNIGTAKPTAEERQRVPQHLIDVADLRESFDAGRFVEMAKVAVAEIEARGRVPIFCGGTGMYFRAFLEGLGSVPASDPAVRAALEATPMAELLEELGRLDPASFERIDRQNPRRVWRALEVIRLTGRPFSEQRARWADESEGAAAQDVPVGVGLCRSGEDLRRRIDQRVDVMFQRGLVEETQRLLSQGLAENRVAMQALGYRQVVEYLQGERSLPETIEMVKSRTRKFAKRQMTWFRGQFRLAWLTLDEGRPADVDAVIRALDRRF
jgi:tRNA dimethylallyltransferase